MAVNAAPPPAPMPACAMVLAAGLGLRMRPLTADTAKPLLQLDGRPLLDHALDRLEREGIRRVVVNAHWHADRIAAHLRAEHAHLDLAVRPEADLLDTGGAVAAALAEGLLGTGPFLVANGDNYWLDGPAPTIARLAARFAAEDLDAVLLVHRACQVRAAAGRGDFLLDGWGRPTRPRPPHMAPYVYAGLQLVSPRLLEGAPAGAFSMNLLWDRAIAAGRLRAVVHDGLWFHLTSPADLAEAERALREDRTGETT